MRSTIPAPPPAVPTRPDPDLRDLVADLRRRVRGEVRFDPVSRAIYSSDASIYEVEPLGVVLPRDADDVQAVVEVARDAGAPLLPRGGGTSLAGQTVGRAVVVDFSKYMNRVLEVNAEAGWARVQPGIVRHELLRALAPAGLLYGPETSTSTRATIGGMIGNNSSGSRSLVYGKTVDTVVAVRATLADGTAAVFDEVPAAEASRRAHGGGTEARLYREVARIVEGAREEVARRFPRVQRRVGGYNLDEFPPDGRMNLAKLVVGSEGTLAVVTEATVRLARRPAATVLAVFQFDDIIPALEHTAEILETHPTAVELTDRYIIDLARKTRELSQRLTFVDGDPGAIIAVEYAGETQAALVPALDRLEAKMRRAGYRGEMRRILDPAAQTNLWAVREAGVGLLLGMKSARKPVAFVEDSAVGPERIAEYTRRFRDIVRCHGTDASFYGHASVGLLHTRPILDLHQPRDVAEMRAIAEEVADLVREFGGALSGEHGDGLSRGEFVEKMFGPALYAAFRGVKAAFDPEGRMNPGKIVDAPPMTESLRYRHEAAPPTPPTIQDFSRDGGVRSAIELCSGVGACRKPRGGTMCPSYMVTLEEAHSTRGRANALRAAISGQLPAGALTSRELYDVMDLCIACKACKAECPSNVDMAKLKHEFLAGYYDRHGLPRRARLFGHVADLGPLGCAAAPLANPLLASAPVRWALERFAGIDARRRLPPFARRRFSHWWRTRGGNAAGAAALPAGRAPEQALAAIPGRGRAALFVDTFTEYYYPSIGEAAVRVLESAGCRVEPVLPLSCCGRPMISNGMLREAQALGARTLGRLRAFADAGVPIVGLEPSCIVTFRDEYPDLLPGAAAEAVARATLAFEEYLGLLAGAGVRPPYARRDARVLLHGHCHQKAMIRTAPALAALRAVPGSTVEEIDSGCCGMAGSFGIEREHYDVSIAMGERVLFKAVREASADTVVVASGTSCRQQIAHGTGRWAVHLAEALALALPPNAGAAAGGSPAAAGG